MWIVYRGKKLSLETCSCSTRTRTYLALDYVPRYLTDRTCISMQTNHTFSPFVPKYPSAHYTVPYPHTAPPQSPLLPTVCHHPHAMLDTEMLDPDTRKRARSPSPSAAAVPSLVQQPCLPLTSERLALHTSLVESQTHPTTAAISMASPPSSSCNSTSALSVFETEPCDNEDKLNVYGILVCTGKALPADIHNFVSTLQAGTRSSLDTAHSPNTRKVAQQQCIAQHQSKLDGINMLRDFLLFPDHAHEPMLAIGAQHNLNKDFLPSDAALAEFWGPLETPRTDHLYGYRSFNDSQGPTAFSRDHERILHLNAIASGLHFPFISVRWKSPRGSQGHYHARLQGMSSHPTPLSNLRSLITAPRCT
jgi:hypothetical protein